MALPKWEHTGRVRYDFAINGVPFLSAANSEYPYVRQTSSFAKNQIDTANTPGEQSLQGWWYRSQNSFDLGAGVIYNDTLKDETVSRRCHASYGVDLFSEPGKVQMLSGYHLGSDYMAANRWPVEVRQIVAASSAQSETNFGYAPDSTINAFAIVRHFNATTGAPEKDSLRAIISGSTLNPQIDDNPQSWTEIPFWLAGHPANPFVNSMTGIGNGVILATTSGLYQRNIDGSPGYFRRYTNVFDYVTIVKERLIAFRGNKIYQLDPIPSTQPVSALTLTDSDVFYTHADSNWSWVAASEGPNRIYFAGRPQLEDALVADPYDLNYANRSMIYASSIEQQSNQLLPKLYVPVVVAELPDGEFVSAMTSYLGTYLVLGTTAGVRIGLIDGSGGLVTGPLSVETRNAVSHLATWGNYVFAAGRPKYQIKVDNEIVLERSSTIIRLDLSKTVESNSLLFAWHEDQSYPGLDPDEELPTVFGAEADFERVYLTTPGKVNGFTIVPERVESLNSTANFAAGQYLNTAARGPRLMFSFTVGYGTLRTADGRVAPFSGLFTSNQFKSRRKGILETGRIRFDTSENKIFQYLQVAAKTTGNFNVPNVQFQYWYSEDGPESTVQDLTQIQTDPEVYASIGSDLTPREWVAYRFIFDYQESGGNIAPKGFPWFYGYQVKAQPSGVKQRTIRVALLCANREEAPSGTIIERSVVDRIQALEQAEELGAVVLFQDLGTSEERECLIDNIQYISDYIPQDRAARTQKPGILLVTLRAINSIPEPEA